MKRFLSIRERLRLQEEGSSDLCRQIVVIFDFPRKSFHIQKAAGCLCVRPVTAAGLLPRHTEPRHFLAESKTQARAIQERGIPLSSKELRPACLLISLCGRIILYRQGSFGFLRIASLTPNRIASAPTNMNRLIVDGHLPADAGGDILELDRDDALYYSPVLSATSGGEEGIWGSRFLEDAAGGGDDGGGGGGGSADQDVSGPLNTLAEIASNLLLFLLIFGMSATVDMKNLKNQLHNKWAILTGVVMQFVLMPLLGYLTILVLRDHGFTDAMGITLLIVTASPGGLYSNWWCSLFNAELALSVCMTAISTVFAVVFLPANLLLYTHAAYGFTKEEEENILSNVDFKAIFISLAIVILAIVSGLYASYRLHSPRFQLWSNRLGSISGILLIVFSAVISSTAGGKDDDDQEQGGTKLWDQTWAFYIGVAAPCVVGLVLANFFSRMARLNPPEIVTVSVECCYQNVGIATSAAVAMFDDPQQRAEALCGK